ncbi:MAG: hypothetical protein IIT46_05530 [Lachnospiraceae bacterium]|jgi:M6 family metalloprotease-like protein|nr:hypothetical protein [Lachnospiraceae bacterium]
MRKEKKILAAFLAGVVLVSSFGIPSFRNGYVKAEEANEVAREETETNPLVSDFQLDCDRCNGVTVWDTYYENYEDFNKDELVKATSEDTKKTRTIQNLAMFIRFSNESKDIYDQRGGKAHFKNEFYDGVTSVHEMLDQFSNGKMDAELTFLNEPSDCFVDNHKASYYRDNSAKTLLQSCLDSIGQEKIDKYTKGEDLYNLVFFVPDEQGWSDELWSQAGTVKWKNHRYTYNLITYPDKREIRSVLTHELMHCIGFPDMYHYDCTSKCQGDPVGHWSTMAYPYDHSEVTVYEKLRYSNWFEEQDAVRNLTKDGTYTIGPSNAYVNGEPLAFRIPVENEKYIMMEYRGALNCDKEVGIKNGSGLIFYRVDESVEDGNVDGGSTGKDQVYILRNQKDTLPVFTGDIKNGLDSFSNFSVGSNGKNLGIKVTDIKKVDGKIQFTITGIPSVKNTATPTLKPTATATIKPTATPTIKPTVTPTIKPTATPTIKPTSTPTLKPSITPAATEQEFSENLACIYYKRSTNTSWKKVYAHYKIDGIWTVSPGVQMEKMGDGYWKIQIPYKRSSEITICFNNGSGTWDNQNGKNYTVQIGNYLIDQTTKKVTEIKTEPTATVNIKPTISSTVEGTNVPTIVPTAIQTLEPTVIPIVTPSIMPTDTKVGNIITVYYKRSTKTSWKNAYIHFKYNNKWTKVPGVKMTKISSGYWVFTVDIGDTTKFTACFNNGSGTWDNNNTKNYTLGTGTWLVDQTSKKVKKLDEK